MTLFKIISEIFIISCVIGVGVSYGNLYLFHLILASLIIYSIRLFKKNQYQINLNFFSRNYIFFLPFFFGWYFLSIFWSINKLYTMQYLFYIFCGIAIVLAISINFNTKEALNKAIKIAGITFSVEIFLSLLESISPFRLPISPFSNVVTFFGRNQSLQPTLDSFAIPSMIQPPTGFQWNPNDLAVTMIMLIPFFLFSKKNLIKWVAIISIVIIIVMTSSRTVILSMGILFLLYLTFYKKKLTLLFLISFVLLALLSQLEKLKESENPQVSEIANTFSTIQNFINDDILFGQSLTIRQELAINGVDALIGSYGIGVGGGGSIAVQEKLGGVDGRITSMHNFWLELVVDAGILFACIFFLWYVSISWTLFKIGIQSKVSDLKYLGKSLSLSMIIFVPAAISSSSVIYFFPMWLMYGFAIATIEADSKAKEKGPSLSSLQYLPKKNF